VATTVTGAARRYRPIPGPVPPPRQIADHAAHRRGDLCRAARGVGGWARQRSRPSSTGSPTRCGAG